MGIQLIGGGVLIALDAENTLIEDGCVAVKGGEILDFGTTAEMKSRYAGSVFRDARGALILPGFINAHGHIYSAMARGMSLSGGKVSKNFAQILENLWWRLDRALGPQEIEYSAYTTYLDGIRNGVTTVFDHHASAGYVRGSLQIIAEAAKKIGVRTSLCYEVSDRDGSETARAGIDENAEFIRYANAQDDMLSAMFGLHASFTLSDETLAACAQAAGGAGFHVHVAEGIEDLRDSQSKYGMRVAQRLDRFGILKPNTLAVHCIHIDEDEQALIRQRGAAVVHNPESNMGNAVGAADVIGMMQKGILVGLGTDGYTTDMLESMKAANLIAKHERQDPGAGWAEPPRMLLNNNAAICARHFEKPLGVIEPGAHADIIVADYQAPTPVTENNIHAHLLFGLSGRCVKDVMIGGKYVMQDRQILTVDEQEVYAQARQAAKAFWQRV